MIKLQTDEYENSMCEVERLHKESLEFVNEYITELNSILIPNGGFHTAQVSEKIEMLLDMFQHRLVPELADMFENTEREIELLGENISEVDEEGRLNIQWEE